MVNLALNISSNPKSLRKRARRSARKEFHRTTRLKSHYQFKNWYFNASGIRSALTTKMRERADLISTAYYNPATDTKTVHALAFDLDYDKADDRWKSGGKLDWAAIFSDLLEKEPIIAHAISFAVSSSSGRGLGLAVSISPLEIDSSTIRAQISAFTLQNHLIAIFNGYGMGADPAAVGLVRDMPNWFNPSKVIYMNETRKAAVDNHRFKVVSELLGYTNVHPFVRYRKKSERFDILWPHEGSEKKLSGLYLLLFDELSMSRCFSFSALKALTGLSDNTLYKVLSCPPGWLKVDRINKYEGYRLTLIPSGILTHRAECLLASKLDKDPCESAPALKLVPPVDLKRPCEVEDGERNAYLTKVALTLKHGGVHESEALGALKLAACDIPGSTFSRNCRSAASIGRSIYKNKPSLFGIKGFGIIPGWLLAKGKNPIEGNETLKSFKKGISGAYSHFGAVVLGCGPEKNEFQPFYSFGEFEGSALMPPNDLKPSPRPSAQHGNAVVLDFIGSFLPDLAGRLKFGAPKSVEEPSSVPKMGEIFDETPYSEASAEVSLKKFRTLYEKNRSEFSDRHPIDRFDASLGRLLTRYSPSAIYDKLTRVHCDIIAAGHKDKFRGVAAKYLPPRDPFRRIVMAFLLMSFSMQCEILKIISEG